MSFVRVMQAEILQLLTKPEESEYDGSPAHRVARPTRAAERPTGKLRGPMTIHWDGESAAAFSKVSG